MFNNLTVVIQGSVSSRTVGVIEAFRLAAPECEIILSTWTHNKALADLVDCYIVSPDPGTMPVMHQGQLVRTENTNRQILSTAAGVCRASRMFTMKWRTDFSLDPKHLRQFLERYTLLLARDPMDKLVTFSINSTNPFAGVGLVAQLSDWMYFGRTEFLRRFLAMELIPNTPENVEIPTDRFDIKIFPFARFSAEQWILRDGFKKIYGIELNYFNDPIALPAYLRLIGHSILIINPRKLGLVTHKYDQFFIPHWKTLREFIGFRLSTISQIDSTLLGAPGLYHLAIGLLKLKGSIFNTYKYIAKRYLA